MSTVALAQDLGIESTCDLKQHLAPHLGRSGALRVDASQVARVHTAAIQVLCEFCGERCMSARILVVDDSASMRQMVAFALTSAGFSVEEAEDGAVALGRAKGARFNAVVTDVNMPNMDGISLIRELRQLPDYKFTPMLMLTTESAADKKSEGKAAGATGWLVKPFNPEQLVATVQKVLG
jgi:two-component system chemotaxis response regulator CheY